jgi:hypothetical protein
VAAFANSVAALAGSVAAFANSVAALAGSVAAFAWHPLRSDLLSSPRIQKMTRLTGPSGPLGRWDGSVPRLLRDGP